MLKQKQNKLEEQEESSQLVYSSEDEDANLLTDKVECKLLQTIAKIKTKDPSIYQKKESIFDDEDFSSEDNQPNKKQVIEKKFTYKDMINQQVDSEESQQQLAPALQQKKAKNLFKKAIQTNAKDIDKSDDLFVVKSKITKPIGEKIQINEKEKFEQLTKKLNKESKALLKNVWESDKLDQTDLFLKNYILDKKWLSSKYQQNQTTENKIIDEEDEERSLQMDQYEAQYNFRFEQPGGTTITQYPRKVQQSLRISSETRKEKRKKLEQRKKQQQLEIKKQAEIKKKQLKQNILQKLNNKQIDDENLSVGHDWFFCDDCCRGLVQGQRYYGCLECEDYILCEDCNELIIHKHLLVEKYVEQGFGAPLEDKSAKILSKLKSCKICHKRITSNKICFEYTDKSYLLNTLCQKCFDESNLQVKKKYKKKEPQSYNYEELIQNDPQKIKQLTNLKQIQEMVDQYMKNEFQDVIGDGIRTKFRYINVKPESFGLSDEQILFGDDKQLNKYVSIKQLAPYRQGEMKLRNSRFNKKTKDINRSVKTNKKIIEKGNFKFNKIRFLKKVKQRAEAVKQRRTKKLRILNLSSEQAERNHFVSSSRLASYGVATSSNQ